MAPRLSRRARRWRHHLGIALGSGAVLLVGMAVLEGDLRSRISLTLAYLALAALAATLSLGSLNLIRQRPNPVSSDLRRDFGIWSALLALAHTGVGLTVHFRGRMSNYFLVPDGPVGWRPLRLDPFGLANHTGLIAALLLAGLLVISSDAWLARLGRVRWKRWQRASYVVAGLTAGHGVLYMLLEQRPILLVMIFTFLITGAIVAQTLGFRATRSLPSARDPG